MPELPPMPQIKIEMSTMALVSHDNLSPMKTSACVLMFQLTALALLLVRTTPSVLNALLIFMCSM